jgi:hypothetical protein
MALISPLDPKLFQEFVTPKKYREVGEATEDAAISPTRRRLLEVLLA